MKKPLLRKIKIPEGMHVVVSGESVNIKGPEGEVSRKFNLGKVNLFLKENEIFLENTRSTKNEKKIMNTVYSHLKNMIKGAQKQFEYRLKICFGHFPFTVKQEGKKIMIKNFLGEKVDRILEVPDGVDIEIKKEIITVKSANKELAGQASANFETATRIRGRDKRTFQDGIYIIEKGGKRK